MIKKKINLELRLEIERGNGWEVCRYKGKTVLSVEFEDAYEARCYPRRIDFEEFYHFLQEEILEKGGADFLKCGEICNHPDDEGDPDWEWKDTPEQRRELIESLGNSDDWNLHVECEDWNASATIKWHSESGYTHIYGSATISEELD